jgi:CheY-like chemotaxis protein
MAVILIIDDEGSVAGRMARTLQRGGHLPVIAPDVRSAIRGAALQPEGILLDLELSSTPADALLRSLRQKPELMYTPVLATTGRMDEAVSLRRASRSGFSLVLHKPVPDATLCLAVWAAVSARNGVIWSESLAEMPEDRRRAFLRSLVEEGPEWLALEAYRRICPEKVRFIAPLDGTEPLSWSEILDWVCLLGLLDGV